MDDKEKEAVLKSINAFIEADKYPGYTGTWYDPGANAIGIRELIEKIRPKIHLSKAEVVDKGKILVMKGLIVCHPDDFISIKMQIENIGYTVTT
jgi:hypothetical protein